MGKGGNAKQLEKDQLSIGVRGGEGSLLQSKQAPKAGSCDGIFLSNLNSTNEASVGKSAIVE